VTIAASRIPSRQREIPLPEKLHGKIRRTMARGAADAFSFLSHKTNEQRHVHHSPD
jgi:hypothetical protein